MKVVRYSMIKAYRRCPKQHEYREIRHLQRKKPAVPLLRGTILHEMLDARATGGKPAHVMREYQKKYGALLREEREEYGMNFLEDIQRIYDGYDAQYTNDRWTYEASEELLETELAPGILFKGHLDKRIVTQKDGRRWIVDHKTHKHIPDEAQRFNDYQILMYLWAWNREHPKEKANGIIWDYLRTKAPTVPERLKNGQLSQAKNIDTDVVTYTREIRRHNLDPRSYREFLAELTKRSENKFYIRIPLPAPSKEMMEAVVNDFRDSAMILHGISRYPRTMTRDCSWCEFYRLCSAELRGLDWKFVEKTEFEPRQDDKDRIEED